MNTKKFLFILALVACWNFSNAQGRELIEVDATQLKPANITLQSLLDKEDLSVKYHKTVNDGIKEVLDGAHLDGLMTLKKALNGALFSLGVDWFVAAYASAYLNDKQGIEIHLREGAKSDKNLIDLWNSPAADYLFREVLDADAHEKHTELLARSKAYRNDLPLIEKLKELEHKEQEIDFLKKQLRDSILVHHKSNKALVRDWENQIKLKQDELNLIYDKIPETKAWPIQKLNPKAQESLAYTNESDWFKKNQAKLNSLMQLAQLQPWDFAFIHDWHARKHGLEQLYALFPKQQLNDEVIENCERIGMPWGAVRNVRLFYKLD